MSVLGGDRGQGVKGSEMECAKINVEILSYDRKGVKEVIRKFDRNIFNGLKNKVKVKLIAKAGTTIIVHLMKFIAEVPSVGEKALRHKGVQNVAADQVTKTVNKNLKKILDLNDKQKFISIDEILIKKKKGGKAMKLEVELNDVDLTKMLDIMLKKIKQQKTDKRRKKLEIYKKNGDVDAAEKLKGDNVLKGSEEMMFHLLETINKEVDNNRKFELIQSMVMWANESGLVGIVLKALAESEGKMSEIIQAMKLEIGDISLTKQET